MNPSRRDSSENKIKGKEPITRMPEIFVGGLPSNITAFILRTYFEEFGEIAEIRLMRYKDNYSRGFAFVRFACMESTYLVLSQSKLTIRGKPIECKLALKKRDSKLLMHTGIQRRIFVNHLSPETTEADLKAYFSSFGEVVNIRIITTLHSNESRGFGFVTFSSKLAAQEILAQQSKHAIKNSIVECRPALLRNDVQGDSTGCNSRPASKQLTVEVQGNYLFRRRPCPGHPRMKQLIKKLNAQNKTERHEISTQSPTQGVNISDQHLQMAQPQSC